MKPFKLTGWVVLVLLLLGCQGFPAETNIDNELVRLRSAVSAGDLDIAWQRLQALERYAEQDERIEEAQKALAAAYMQRGQTALQQGDLDEVARSLYYARQLLSEAPALTVGNRAVAHMELVSATDKAANEVALPMLDTRDNAALYRALDDVAQALILGRCPVHIEARDESEYRRIAHILRLQTARHDPQAVLRMTYKIVPEQVPRLLFGLRQ